MKFLAISTTLCSLLLACRIAGAADYPEPMQGDYVIRNFKFASGESLPQLRIHYRTLGHPARDAKGRLSNAILILHGTTGNGGNFIRAEFAGELFGPDQPLDANRFFIILPDGIGHGQSSKPSDGLHGHFPHYGYADMVDAQYLLLTQGLGVDHARLILGTSMGGMHAWLWGERYPDFMDALMPLASVPTQISGRNRVWRRLIIDAIRHDPTWQGGDYGAQPAALRTAGEMLWLMSENPVLRAQQSPTLAQADRTLDAFLNAWTRTADANDVLYAVAASQDYDPGPGLEKIRAPLLAVNSADDLINPPEIGVLEREIKRVAHGTTVMVPFSARTHGHGSHTIAALWKSQLQALLRESQPDAPPP